MWEKAREISCLPPRNMHGERMEEDLCHGLAVGIITTAGAVTTDKTGLSSPIGAMHQAE
jgi:hypothetical protein